MADANKIYDDVLETLHDQVKKIARKGDAINAQELDNMYKAIDVIKDISTIKAMEKADSEYSADYSADYSGRYHYPRSYGGSYDHEQMSRDAMRGDMSREQWGNSRDGMSHRRGRDARTGRYVSRDGSYDGSYDRSYDGSYDDYSTAGGTEKMLEKMEAMIENAPNERVKSAIDQCMQRIRRLG